MLHAIAPLEGSNAEAIVDLEQVFSGASVLAMLGWVALLASPWTPIWAQRIGGVWVPLVLSAGYVALLAFSPEGKGGYASLADVSAMFSQQEAVLAGWVHYLAFDLLIGAWICRTAKEERVRFWLVVPCLALTFLFGPAGFLLFSGVRLSGQRAGGPAEAV